MKAHIGVDLDSKRVHTVVCTTAKVADARVLEQLLHGQERSVHGDRAYTSNSRHPLASDPHRGVLWCMPFKRPRGGELDPEQAKINRLLARLRARVEHPFRVLKCQFGYRKVRYRGIRKNAAALTTKFALANLYLARRQLLVMAG
jgi:IS5 family transposase